MPDSNEIISLLQQQKLLPLFYHESETVSIRIMEAMYAAGIRLIEYTNRGAQALKNFEAMRNAASSLPGMRIGIGTIKNEPAALAFIDAGADFIICPTVNAAVAHATQAAGLLWIPGCMTPTEIAMAEESGAQVVKIFPGGLLGPSYIQAIKPLFPTLQFMPTGGVAATAANLEAWFGAGVVAVGMGTNLITASLIQQEAYAQLTADTQTALTLAQAAGAASFD